MHKVQVNCSGDFEMNSMVKVINLNRQFTIYVLKGRNPRNQSTVRGQKYSSLNDVAV